MLIRLASMEVGEPCVWLAQSINPDCAQPAAAPRMGLNGWGLIRLYDDM